MKKLLAIFIILNMFFSLTSIACAGTNTSADTSLKLQTSKEARYLNSVFNKVDVKKDILYTKISNESERSSKSLDIYQPTGDSEKSRYTVLLIHGGGFTGGDKSEMANIATELAGRGYVVVSMNYTLFQNINNWQAVFDSTVNDTVAVIKWLKDNSKEYRIDTAHIAIGGASAGGSISLETAFSQEVYNEGIKFFAVINMYGGAISETPNKNSPPVIIIHGDNDGMVPYSTSTDLKKKLDAQKIDNELYTMKGAGHGIPQDYFDEVMTRISGFLFRASGAEAAPVYSAKTDSISTQKGVEFQVNLKRIKNTNISALDISMPEDWNIVDKEVTIKNDGSTSFKVMIPHEAVSSGDHFMSISSQYNGKPVGDRTVIDIKIKAPVIITTGSSISNNDLQGLQQYFILKNASKSFTISGKVKITGYVNDLSFTLAALKPGKECKFELPQDINGNLNFNIALDNGEKYDCSKGIVVTGAVKTQKPPTIDGDISDWGINPSLTLENKSQTEFIDEWKGKDDLSCKIYLMWDDENLYLATVAKDDVFNQTHTNGDIWGGDSLQLAFDRKRTSSPGSKGTDEFGFAMNGNTIYKWRWISSEDHNTGEVNTASCSIKRVDTYTTYEIALPWKEILKDGVKPVSGTDIGFSFLINDNDGNGRRGWIEFGGGIGGTKDPSLFGDLYLVE